MPPKKKPTQTTPVQQSISNDDKFVVLRELTGGMFLVINFNDLLNKDKAKISTGAEVAYKTKNRDGGRGTILLIDDEEKCLSLVQLLEKKESASLAETAKSSNMDDSEQSQDENDDDQSEESPTINKHSNQTVRPNTNSTIEIIRPRPSKPLAEKNQDSSSTAKKRANENDEGISTSKRPNENDEGNSTSKRVKEDDPSKNYLRSRIIALQDENKKLRNKIEEMETSWMPRPDQVTIEYFSKIVTICTGQNEDYEESKGEKLAAIMDILAMSEDELLQCTDPKSIRNTCRRVVRVVFKDELSNPRIHFRSVLQQTQKISAVRGK